MLETIGVSSMNDLLVDIPQTLRLESLQLPAGLSEFETMAQVTALAKRNRVFADRLTFRGGGVYRRFIPAAVAAVTSKPEFYTAYTPYQAEASQGTLQAIFEFQTLIAELTALDVANASLYDGATAVAEAAMMAFVQTGRNEVIVSGYVHPEYVQVLRAFGDGRGIKVRKDGEPNKKTAAVIFQQPDFLGLLVDPRALTAAAHDAGALAIAVVDPISLAVLAPPGEYGADIAVGEGQQLGMAPSFGGPHVGFIACRKELVRKLPGRLVGTAHDVQGRRGFVLALAAREQHIRREKATSNICTNHSLCALAAAVYLTYMGPYGLRQVAEVSFKRAHALAERLAALPGWPRLSEPELMRHYSRLASLNYSISENFYPLGSCTMKYNPVANEAAAALPGFAGLHPYQDEETVQGALELMWRLEQALCAVVGVDRVTLQPAAGAHGEWTALRMIRAYQHSRGEARTEVLVPDSAHGTNPASAALSGFQVVEVKSGGDGRISLADLESKLSPRTSALMLTNPNTLGLFEREILDIAELVHSTGAMLYYDGANLNAFMGICRPGDMGFDAVHMNLPKTFTTSPGRGGPGAGPVGVKTELVPFLPSPTVERTNGRLTFDHKPPQSIGRVRSFYGNFGMLVRAYTYILAMGGDGLSQASRDAVLSANYLRKLLDGHLEMPHDGPCMHEFVASAHNLTVQDGVRALDLAKALLDREFYAPTVYFPLVVPEAIMVEPTETESKATLDAFAQAVREIVAQAKTDPQGLHQEPKRTPVGRLDEVAAARRINAYLQGQSEDPVLRWKAAAESPS